ncbi:hypothetical protein JCM39068_40860 [Desulfocastanea catecholica]
MVGLLKTTEEWQGVEQTTKYKAEVMACDLLQIKSKILEVKDKTIRKLSGLFTSCTIQKQKQE